jgi:hypothetical protein
MSSENSFIVSPRAWRVIRRDKFNPAVQVGGRQMLNCSSISRPLGLRKNEFVIKTALTGGGIGTAWTER